MWRIAAILFLWATSASAWAFSPTPVCTLSHDTADARVQITYDATVSEYRLLIELRTQTWPDAPQFAISFSGDRALRIVTDSHVLSENATSVSVTDSGFGNVLNGLEFNRSAIATLGDTQLRIPLNGAALPIQQFRACPAPGLT